jgi:hypothetical protein
MYPEYPKNTDKIPLAVTIVYPGGVLRTILELTGVSLAKTAEAAQAYLAQDTEFKEWSEGAGQSTFRKRTVRARIADKWYSLNSVTDEKTLLELIGLMSHNGVPQFEVDIDVV